MIQTPPRESFSTLSNSKSNLSTSSSAPSKSNKRSTTDYQFGLKKSFDAKRNSFSRLSTTSLQAAPKQEVVSITYEEIGLFPRSFSRVLDRFLKQVFSDVENLVIQEYRFYRYLFLTTLKCLLILFFVPFIVNFLAKSYVVRPLTEYFWNTKQTEIFLNSYQQKHAFSELKDFEEKLYFESLIYPKSLTMSQPEMEEHDYNNSSPFQLTPLKNTTGQSLDEENPSLVNSNFARDFDLTNQHELTNTSVKSREIIASKTDSQNSKTSFLVYQTIEADKNIQQRYQEKTLELAQRYNDQSVEAITNFFGDVVSLVTLFYLLYVLEIQINITQSFLLEVFFGLDDSKKSLLILLVTDLLVGYHSSNLWELFFELFFNHYGLPESQTGIFLLVATLPVLLDVLFKYLIFRHLNRSSPATVATYHAIIE